MKLKNIFYIFLFLNFLFSSYIYSQKYNSVDSIVDTYPKNVITADSLVELINKDFSKQNEKARAVFRWVATNITYDVSLAESMNYISKNAFSYKTEKERDIKEKKFKLDLVSATMNTKKTVCHGYAALMEYLYLKLGLESTIVFGNLKADPSQIGEMPDVTNHAWNVVKIDNVWQFVDATLAAGFVSSKTNLFKFYFNDAYFFTNPDRFFLNHYPADEKWLLVAKSKTDFALLPVFFGGYFQNNYEIIKPESGICSTQNNHNLIFAIRGLDEYDTIAYSSSIDNIKTYLNQKNDLDYTIPILDKKDSYVTIFVSGKIIAIYKII
jgi:transglutaminase/protease-like cytokinesis protein 3